MFLKEASVPGSRETNHFPFPLFLPEQFFRKDSIIVATSDEYVQNTLMKNKEIYIRVLQSTSFYVDFI